LVTSRRGVDVSRLYLFIWCGFIQASRSEVFDRYSNAVMSFLELEGLHVFVTGAAGGIGSAIVDEFLGMYNTSRDYNPI
jgi:hypothetical protein